MYEEPQYIFYRNRQIPGWWKYYLPEEVNPYQSKDTLTLEKGCLANYWHIHSSNKHPNYRGAEACNFVHKMIYEQFGGAFLTPQYFSIGGRKGERSCHEPDHIVYKNGYVGEDGKIHIKNARRYYEDVIIFVQNVLREISKNHYPSGIDCGADQFFPYGTDAEIEAQRKEAEIKKEKTRRLREKMEQFVSGTDFLIDTFEFEKVGFSAYYDTDDGWFNQKFDFNNVSTNIAPESGRVSIMIVMPHLYHSSSKKKNPQLATVVMKLPYCFCLHSRQNEETHSVTVAVPERNVADSVKQKISEACNQAMEEYNQKHMNAIEHANWKPLYKYYPPNIFLDNRIGKLELVYRETMEWDWRFG